MVSVVEQNAAAGLTGAAATRAADATAIRTVRRILVYYLEWLVWTPGLGLQLVPSAIALIGEEHHIQGLIGLVGLSAG